MNPRITPAIVAERTAAALCVKLEFSAAACVVRNRPTTLMANPMASERISLMLNPPLLNTTNLAKTNCRAKLTTPVTINPNASQ